MASVLFSTVGQALGGPLGAAVGAAVGGTVDGALFGGRRAPSSDLLVQRSAYGEVLPRLYGRTRSAGIVVWAPPLAAGGGKGSGRQRRTISFAVALSARPIDSIGRIWADGREIRDADGEFESTTMMRVHRGMGRQGADPVIVAVEGMSAATGFQGLAYVVFEDMDLEPFGNRIPNLSFEVLADPGPATRWLGDLAGAEVAGELPLDDGPDAIGYTAMSERAVDDIAVLARVCAGEVAYPSGELKLRRAGDVVVIPRDALAVIEKGAAEPLSRAAALGERPGALSLDYLDPDRDFQAGRQTVTRGRRGPIRVAAAPLV